jgi:uncharacterized membrane protein YfcA
MISVLKANRYWIIFAAFAVALWTALFFGFMPAPLCVLKENGWFVVVGFAGAVVGNITALGGGIVFIPLMMWLGIPPVHALKIAIVTQSFGMTSGAVAWAQLSKVPTCVIPWAVPGMLIGSTISSLLVRPNPLLVKGLFGPVSITLGILLLIGTYRHLSNAVVWNQRAKFAVAIVSVFGGMVTGWVAIGEGELIAALLMIAFGFAAESAISLGVLLLAVNSIYLAAVHILILGNIPWTIAAFTALGAIFGARLAPLISSKISEKVLKTLFAVVAITDGTIIAWQFITSLTP